MPEISIAPAKVGMDGDKGLGGDDGGGQPAFHVAGAAPVDLAVDQFTAKGVVGPAVADLDHVGMAVEMHAIARAPAFAACDDVPARVFVAVAGRAVGADQFGFKPRSPQTPVQIVADRAIIASRRVQRGDADQVLGQRDQVIAPVGDCAGKLRVLCHGLSIRVSGGTDNGVILKLHSAATKEPHSIAMLHPACYAKGPDYDGAQTRGIDVRCEGRGSDPVL